MRYDQRSTITEDMSDWGKSYVASPPSSRYGEDDASSVTHSRPRRSRLDKDIAQQAPLMLPPLRPASSRKIAKNGIDPNIVNGRRSVGHNSTFNGYDLNSYQRPQYPISRNGNESFSGRYPSSRNISAYAAEYLNSRNGTVGILPNKMREPKRPRSTAAEKYTEQLNGRNGFGGYESNELSTSDDGKKAEEDEEASEVDDEEEEEMRNYYLQAQRVQGSRSVTNTVRVDPFVEGGEAYYFGVVHLDLELVGHVMKTIPPPPEYYDLQAIEKVAYVFYCAVYKKPYRNIEEFHKRFNREFYRFVCAGDSNDLALFKICKSMQDQYTLRQLEASKRAYEKAQKEALENEKLDFNQHRMDLSEQHQFSQPEEVLSYGPLKFHTGHAFATFGIGGKMIVIRPAGTVDPNTNIVQSSTSVVVEDVRGFLHSDQHSSKVIESIQSFKGPLIAGQTPTHSVRLYIQRQIDALRLVERTKDVKKSEVMDALLIWQLLEIMVQQHGRVTGPDVATLLTNASEELEEKTGVIETNVKTDTTKAEAKERFNKFLLGGHINEAIESAISDGLYADAMTLIRRLHPNDAKKIEEIETRFMQLRSIDDPFATLVAVSSGHPPPVLTSSSFDDDNNWKRHAAIVLANLNTPTAMQTIYHLGLMLAKRERHCAADFCLLAVCFLAGYDPFIPVLQAEGEEKSRKHIGLIHSGSHLLNKIDEISEAAAGFSFTDLHATDIFDYALRLSNNNIDSPLARSKEYQLDRIEYAKKISSYGGFATDAFRYCTEIARSMWPFVSLFSRDTLLDLCDLAESLQYVAAASAQEGEWIGSLRSMAVDVAPAAVQNNVHNFEEQTIDSTLSSEAHKWHDEHQTPIEMLQKHSSEQISNPTTISTSSDQNTPTQVEEEITYSASNLTLGSNSTVSTTLSAQSSETYTPPTAPSPPAAISEPPPPVAAPVPPPMAIPPPVTIPPPIIPKPNLEPPIIPKPNIEEFLLPPMPMKQQQQLPSTPMPIMSNAPIEADLAKSPKSELEDLWNSVPPMPVQQIAPVQRPSETRPNASVPTPTTGPPKPESSRSSKSQRNEPTSNDRKTSKGWFGSIKEKVIKSMPSTNQMILPDDSQPSIVWDPVQKRYIGAGVEEEVVAPPPPAMSVPLLNADISSNKSSTASLRSARNGAGSRYFTPTMPTSNSQTLAPPDAMSSMVPPPMMPLPTSFGFIPAAVDDASSDGFDPFSGEANPTLPTESSSAE